MLFEAYKLGCKDSTEPTTRRTKRISDIPLTNRFFSILVSICSPKIRLRSMINRRSYRRNVECEGLANNSQHSSQYFASGERSAPQKSHFLLLAMRITVWWDIKFRT